MSNTLKVSDVPFLMKQWSPANKADPTTISTGSHHKYQWECKECGYAWKAAVASRYKADGKCPCHESNKVIMPGVNDILTLLPALTDYYDTEKNEAEGIDISREGFDSKVSVNWKCPDCGREWKSAINSRSKKENGARVAVLCPHYNTVKRKKEDVPSVDQVPHLYRFWNKGKNPDASTIKENSSERVDWICSNCGYEWKATVVEQRKSSGKCACCELGKKIKAGTNDLFTVIPEAKLSFNFKKNTNIDISNIGVRSKEQVWWICPDCGFEWKTAIASRVQGKKGSYTLKSCRRCHYANQVTPVASKKALVKYWDFEKNHDYDINLTSAYCYDSVHWKCSDCGYTWEATIKAMSASSQGCLRCNNPEAFINFYPQVLKSLDKIFYQEENPEINISELRIKSSELIHFHCKSCGYKWNSEFGNRMKHDKDNPPRLLGCPMCDNRRKRELTYSEQYPELAAMYNEEASGRTLDSLNSIDARRIKVFWDCHACNRTFPAKLNSMLLSINTSTKGCPFCSHTAIIPGQSFGDLHPELLNEYAVENETNPFEAFPFDKEEVLWRCAKNHTWYASFSRRHRGLGPCPICHRVRPIKGINTFADIYSDYIDIYSENNERKPDEIFYDSVVYYQWKCNVCKLEYTALISDVVSGKPCPFCEGTKAIPNVNSLQALYPDIAKKYSAKNYRPADEVLTTMSTSFIWDCPTCGNEYKAPVCDVIKEDYICPYCDDRLILPNFNDFATRHPDLMEEYNYVINYIATDSNNISEKSNEPLWWTCPKNSDHNYPMSPARKLLFQKRNKEACPYCKGLRRKKRHFI